MKTDEEIIGSGKIWGIQNEFRGGYGMLGGWIKLPDCGTCSVLWSREYKGHVSVSPKHKFNIPTWDDMCILKDLFFYEGEEAFQIHPKKKQYVNVKSNCLHLWGDVPRDL